ncbi:MAG: DUF6463 family protein [Cyclobacteriaceae bacterium]
MKIRHLSKHKGKQLILIGMVHSLVGLLLFWKPLYQIFANGYINSLVPDSLYYVIELVTKGYSDQIINLTLNPYFGSFHFMYIGVVWIGTGYLINWIEVNLEQKIPAFFGWFLMILTLFTVLAFPVSGYWALFIPAFLIIRDNY